jgi:uncharacterized sulfatase
MSRMTRREFLRQSAAGAAFSALAPTLTAGEKPAAPAPGAPAGRPNFAWFICEDSSPDFGCYGVPEARTPNIDRIAAEGVRFTNAFTTYGVCAPSRAGIVTGMYPMSIGAQHMRSSCVPPPYVKVFAEYLRAAGYCCTNWSKTDYNFPPPPSAWDACRQQADWHGRAKGQPFFAIHNILVTHESRHWNSEGKLDHDPAKIVLPPYYPDTLIVRRTWAKYFDNITTLDTRIGGVLKQLDDEGLAANTIVFVLSDHGRGMPRSKRWPYDAGIHLPLIVRWPGKIKPGTVCDDLVSGVDLAPTMLSLAGIKPPAYLQGQVFLGPEKAPPRQYIFAGRDRMDVTYDLIRAVRDKRVKYIKNFEPEKPYAQIIPYAEKMPIMQEMRRLAAEGKLVGPQKLFMEPTKPPEELYDTAADPHEINNLAGKPQYQEVLVRMRGVLEQWMKDVGDTGTTPEEQLKERMRPGGVWAVTADPKATPAGGSFPGPVEVAAACATEGASIVWRIDAGSAGAQGENGQKDARKAGKKAAAKAATAENGEVHWNLYTGPIRLTSSATLRLKACRIGYKDSKEVAAEYKIG